MRSNQSDWSIISFSGDDETNLAQNWVYQEDISLCKNYDNAIKIERDRFLDRKFKTKTYFSNKFYVSK